MVEKLKHEWFNQPGKNILAGIVVALALIPEAIAFSIIAGVDPMVGLYASFIIAVVTAIVGGRPAMISGATGAVAIIVTPLVKDYGVEYLLAATILMGVIQLVLGLLKSGAFNEIYTSFRHDRFCKCIRYYDFHVPNRTYLRYFNLNLYICNCNITHCIYNPKFFKAIPAPLIAIIVLTALYMYTGSDVRTVGDLGNIKQALPHF